MSTANADRPINLQLRRTLLALDARVAGQEQVALTDPTLVRETDDGIPTGVGVEDLPAHLGAAVISTGMVAEAGLRPDDVPHLSVRDLDAQEDQ